MSNLQNVHKQLKGLDPYVDPIEIYDDDVPRRIKPSLEVVESGFIYMDVASIKKGAGIYYKCMSKVKEYLKSLKQFNQHHVDHYYDCEDRAFWTMAHLRYKFPGFPVGVVSSKNKEHAVNVIWYRHKNEKTNKITYKYKYWDPKAGECDEKFGDITAVIGFPIDENRIDPKRVAPIPKEGMKPLDKKIIAFDRKRLIYDIDKIEYYLRNKIYTQKNGCKDHHDSKHTGVNAKRWTDYDEALWTFVHVRRAFPGCPIGVVIGKRGEKNSYENIIWYQVKEGNTTTYPYKLWDPLLNCYPKTKMDEITTIFI